MNETKCSECQENCAIKGETPNLIHVEVGIKELAEEPIPEGHTGENPGPIKEMQMIHLQEKEPGTAMAFGIRTYGGRINIDGIGITGRLGVGEMGLDMNSPCFIDAGEKITLFIAGIDGHKFRCGRREMLTAFFNDNEQYIPVRCIRTQRYEAEFVILKKSEWVE